MKKILILFIIIQIPYSCNFLAPKNIDGIKDWNKNKENYKIIIHDILKNSNQTFKIGENNFPSYSKFKYDTSFRILKPYPIKDSDTIDIHNLTIYFYYDRGLLDHFSALIYSNDSLQLSILDANVKNGGNDYKLENNWYLIND
ncbi:hypothetical protein [Apibacter sp. HY039]|uniref:hypothetical protein n=1 Tax=Apibacter sp. HY039 TaxID=2501476 RepID=UPI000FEB5CFC|nr:hypothetical protein [Apibacter sp. HY039]